jgi:HAD superfamily hydrolase (TIGR01509 family)
MEAMSEIGKMNCMWYYYEHNKIPQSEHFFDSLKVPELHKDTQDMHVYYDGEQLPTILTFWQMGFSTSEEVKQEIHDYYDNSSLTKTEIAVFKGISQVMLDPETFIRTRKRRKEEIELLTELHKEDFLVFGLTNWDTTSFNLLNEKYSDVFAMLSTVIVSGEVNAVKPHQVMFEKMLERLRETVSDLQYNEILFIDDELENIKGAEILGINVYHNR